MFTHIWEQVAELIWQAAVWQADKERARQAH